MSGDFAEQVNHNKQVWKDTYKVADHFKHQPGCKITEIKEDDLEKAEKQELKKVLVLDKDVLCVAEEAYKAGFRPLVISAANENDPMEGVKRGHPSVEGDIIRRSNMGLGLDKEYYPLRNTDAIYLPTVTVFKDVNFKRMTKHFTLPFLVISPIKRPSLITLRNEGTMEDDYENSREAETMRKRIELMFQMAVLKGHHSIVVSDFGVRDNNPQKRIVQYFNEAMKKYPVKYVFFAVASPEPSKKNKSDPVYEYFHKHVQRPKV
jgi:hypothetical protein